MEIPTRVTLRAEALGVRAVDLRPNATMTVYVHSDEGKMELWGCPVVAIDVERNEVTVDLTRASSRHRRFDA